MKEHPIHKGYYVTEKGQVYSTRVAHNNKPLKEPRLKQAYIHKKSGYLYMKIGRSGNGKVHRLVAETYIPNPDNLPIVNHKDGNPLNNNVDNLEWCSQAYNVIHSYIKRCKDSITAAEKQQLLELINSI